jgi:uncharacterized membrane protein
MIQSVDENENENEKCQNISDIENSINHSLIDQQNKQDAIFLYLCKIIIGIILGFFLIAILIIFVIVVLPYL